MNMVSIQARLTAFDNSAALLCLFLVNINDSDIPEKPGKEKKNNPEENEHLFHAKVNE